MRARLLGLVPEERIRTVDVERPDRAVIDAFLGLGDLASTVSDALDELGVGGAISSDVLQPRLPGARVVGPAITIRHQPEAESVGALNARGARARLGDRDLYGIGQPGDVAVFDSGGYANASVMGGLSGRWARRLEIAGCVVDGAVRDVAAIREKGVPVWSRGVTPVTGKHRLAAIELNGPVAIADVAVQPGDLIAADETGICVVPAPHIAAVLELCLNSEDAERSLIEAIESGAGPEEIVQILRPDTW